ncbi:MAG TPA: hypothetical protein VGE74_09660 [Gemmata sp.]
MTLFVELMANLRDRNVPLSHCLRKAKDIAHRLQNKDFIDWVNAERMGYAAGSLLPDYRLVRLEVMIEIDNGRFLYARHKEYDHLRLGNESLGALAQELEGVPLVAGVDELLRYLDLDGIRYNAKESIVNATKAYIQNTQGHLYNIGNIYLLLPKPTIDRIMSIIFDRLHDFLLSVRSEYPEVAQSEKIYEQGQLLKLAGLVSTKILNMGCTLTGGQSVSDRSIKQGDGAHIGGNAITGNVKNSFNHIAGLQEANPLKGLLESLMKAVEEAAGELPAEKADDLRSEVESFVKEATTKARESVLKTFGDSIKSAGSFLKSAAVSGALTGAVDSVFKFFSAS